MATHQTKTMIISQPIGAPAQQNIDDFELAAAPRSFHADEKHQALPAKDGVHAVMPASGEPLYTRLLCYACSFVVKDIFPSDNSFASYCGCICIRQECACALKDKEPFIAERQLCECGMPDLLLEAAYKCLPFKCGCDLGSKLKDKCAKPLVVCFGKTIV